MSSKTFAVVIMVLAALIVLALILGRIPITPLTTRHWLLLGLGFSMFSWSVLAAAVFGLLLMGAAPRLHAERDAPSVVAAFVGLHYVVIAAWLNLSSLQVVLIPLLLFSVATLAVERMMTEEPPHEQLAQAWGFAQIVLVVLAASTAMFAVYKSDPFGAQWATAGWAVLAVSLMGAGFGLRESVYRRVALVVLGVCLLRVFLVDTQGLSDTARTGVFFVLGLCLVGVAGCIRGSPRSSRAGSKLSAPASCPVAPWLDSSGWLRVGGRESESRSGGL